MDPYELVDDWQDFTAQERLEIFERGASVTARVKQQKHLKLFIWQE